VGGTWLENDYPGCPPSTSRTTSTATRLHRLPTWPQYHSPQPVLARLLPYVHRAFRASLIAFATRPKCSPRGGTRAECAVGFVDHVDGKAAKRRTHRLDALVCATGTAQTGPRDARHQRHRRLHGSVVSLGPGGRAAWTYAASAFAVIGHRCEAPRSFIPGASPKSPRKLVVFQTHAARGSSRCPATKTTYRSRSARWLRKRAAVRELGSPSGSSPARKRACCHFATVDPNWDGQRPRPSRCVETRCCARCSACTTRSAFPDPDLAGRRCCRATRRSRSVSWLDGGRYPAALQQDNVTVETNRRSTRSTPGGIADGGWSTARTSTSIIYGTGFPSGPTS